MFKAKTLEDFKELQKTVDILNKDGIFKLRIEVKQEYSECDLYVIDNTEELYYGGCQFDFAMNFLERALKIDTLDDDAYFDCCCPGRYLADFDGRCRYTEKDMESDIDFAIHDAMHKYFDNNDLKPHWTNELREKFDRLAVEIVELIMETIN